MRVWTLVWRRGGGGGCAFRAVSIDRRKGGVEGVKRAYGIASRVVSRVLDMVWCELLRLLVEDGEEGFGEGDFGGHLVCVGMVFGRLGWLLFRKRSEGKL